MKAIKKINNNVALCVDSKGNELIALGKGIGFPKMPYELTDLKQIRKTYYDIDPLFYDLFNHISESIFDLSSQLIEQARDRLGYSFNNNAIFSLADHINFAIERKKKNMEINFTFSYDVKCLYPREMEIGELALKMVKERLNVSLPTSEAISIALHFINEEGVELLPNRTQSIEDMLDIITKVVEQHLNIRIDRDSFDYYRFSSHIRYFLKRITEGKPLADKDEALFKHICSDYPTVYECALKLVQVIPGTDKAICTQQEILYLMLHILRLYEKQI